MIRLNHYVPCKRHFERLVSTCPSRDFCVHPIDYSVMSERRLWELLRDSHFRLEFILQSLPLPMGLPGHWSIDSSARMQHYWRNIDSFQDEWANSVFGGIAFEVIKHLTVIGFSEFSVCNVNVVLEIRAINMFLSCDKLQRECCTVHWALVETCIVRNKHVRFWLMTRRWRASRWRSRNIRDKMLSQVRAV